MMRGRFRCLAQKFEDRVLKDKGSMPIAERAYKGNNNVICAESHLRPQLVSVAAWRKLRGVNSGRIHDDPGLRHAAHHQFLLKHPGNDNEPCRRSQLQIFATREDPEKVHWVPILRSPQL